MKNLKTLLTGLLLLCAATVQAVPFAKDEALVQKLKNQKVKLIVLRHNQAVNNAMGLVTNKYSPGYGLTPLGTVTAQRTGYELASLKIKKIYTSPYFRTMQASAIYGTILKFTPEQYSVDDRLAVQDFGDLNGADYKVYEKSLGKDGVLKGTPKNGESGEKVFQRTRDFLWCLANEGVSSSLVVTHAFNFCHARMLLTGQFGKIPANGYYEVYDFSK